MSFFERLRRAFSFGNRIENTVIPARLKRLNSLTAREHEAFMILVDGYTLKYCAEKMGVKYSTANTYQNAIYRKLGIKSRAKLVIEYKDFAKK